MPIIVRSTANRVFIGAPASSSTAPTGRRGWASPPICSIRWSAPWAAMCSQPRRFTAMTRPCRCSIPAVVGPRPVSCGPMCAMTGLPPDRTPPAVWYRYSPDRKGEHPRAHLRAYSGILQADAYAGFTPLYEDGRILEAACWAHARRKHYDLYAADRPPIAPEAIRRIGLLYAIEREIRGCTPEVRTAVRRDRSAPVLDAMHAWLNTTLRNVSAKAPLAGAIHYTLVRWRALTRFCDDGRIELDNNTAERAIRPLVLGRKNYLFAGSDAGGERAANLYSLIGTCLLNRIDPLAYLRHVLECIGEYPINRIEELLPWQIAPKLTAPQRQAA